MRTLAATFSSRIEAEAACRRLEAIGIARDRIILKDVAAAAAAGPAGGVFLSVKVTTEQVQPAGEILKDREAVEERVVPSADIAPAGPEPVMPPRPLPAFTADPGAALPRGDAQPLPGGSRPAAGDRARRGRYLVYYGFALLAAFIFGAWLGLVA
jgi:hypothetical protein